MARDEATFDIGHPAPDRERVGLGILMLGLFGAPLVWAVQLLLIYGFASYACAGGVLQPPHASPAWLNWLLPLVNVAALLLAALATAASYRNLRRTRHEHTGHFRGVMDAGEGRTRWLSIWGIWMGIVFMLAIAFNTIGVFWAGLCA